MSDGPRVVVVGGGFGGLTAARELGRGRARVTVVDRRNYHTFQPLLYQVATAGLDSGSIAYPIRGVVARRGRADFRWATVTGVDVEGRRVELDDGESLPYDRLVLAAGAITSTFGIPGVAEHAFPLKTLTDAVRLRAHLLEQFERADAHPATQGSPATMNVVVAGGGPTGVELCGGLTELIHGELAKDFPHLDVGQAQIVLLEAADRLLGGFSQRSADRARRSLEHRGVVVRLGAAVEEVGEGWVRLRGGEQISTCTLVWTAGVRANPLGAGLGLPEERGGRIVVGPDLSVPDHPEIYVIGDLAAARDEEGQLYPQLAPVAMQQARFAARHILATWDPGTAGSPAPSTPSGSGRRRRAPERFHYRNKGIMATIGRNSAVAELPLGIRFGGFPAWIAWLGLHLLFLIGFRNRATVLLDWSWNYLTYQRGNRIIVPVVSDDVDEQGRTAHAVATPPPPTPPPGEAGSAPLRPTGSD